MPYAPGRPNPSPASHAWDAATRHGTLASTFLIPAPARVLALGVEHGTAIYERVAALWPAAAAAAAADPDVDDYWRGVTTNRRSGQHGMVTRVAALGGLRSGLDVERATDLVVVMAGRDVYRGLVQEARWTVLAYQAWLFTTLTQQLLDARTVDRGAVDGLSFAGLVSSPTIT